MEYYIYAKDGSQTWTLEFTLEKAQAKRKEAEEYNAAHGNPTEFTIGSYEEFEKAHKSFMTSRFHITETTAEKYDEMLCVLPPILWHTANNVTSFCMSEFTNLTWTNQYAHDRITDKYYVKLVDAYDQTTWIENDPFIEESRRQSQQNEHCTQTPSVV